MSDHTDLTATGPASQQPAEAPAVEPDSTSPDGVTPEGSPPTAVEVPERPVVAVAVLVAHPGNVRRDLDLSAEFLASIRENGILVPLRITRESDGGYRVIDGHRRLAAAIELGLDAVPVDLAGERASDEAGQFLDMWNAHRHRKPLTQFEETDALFAAREAGASKTRIRKSTGLKPQQVTAALAAAGLSGDTRAAVEAVQHELTLEELAILAEFEGEPAALAALLETARWGGVLDHQAERLRQQRADAAEQQRLRGDLEAAGYAVTDGLPPGGQPLAFLTHDGQELTPEAHADCPGRGVFFRPYDPTTPVHYCADPASHGHTLPEAGNGSSDPDGVSDPPSPGASPGPETGTGDEGRRLVIQGNKAWKAAATVRKRWLAAHLFPRRSAPREVAQFVARQLLTMPDPLRGGLPAAHVRALFAEITTQPAQRWIEACDTAATGRLPLLMLAPIATAYEQAMTEGEGRNTWRPDRYSPCPRIEAGRYLMFLASLGYQLSDIEQAVANGEPWRGDNPEDQPSGQDSSTATGREPGAAGTASDDTSGADVPGGDPAIPGPDSIGTAPARSAEAGAGDIPEADSGEAGPGEAGPADDRDGASRAAA